MYILSNKGNNTVDGIQVTILHIEEDHTYNNGRISRQHIITTHTVKKTYNNGSKVTQHNYTYRT
jgi:hypothetical protein